MSDTIGTVGWTITELAALARDELFEIFLGLPSPTEEEFRGELSGHSPAYIADSTDAYYAEIGLGGWLGKGYASEPVGPWPGHGYNLWEGDGGVSRRMCFGWELGTSVFDGGPCLLMHYRAFQNEFGAFDLVDEIRKAGDDVYLGLAMTKEPTPLAPEPGGPDGRTRPNAFLLSGPAGPWIGPDDPDRERPA